MQGSDSVVMNGDWFLDGARGGGDMAGRGRQMRTPVGQSSYSDIQTPSALLLTIVYRCLRVSTPHMPGAQILV